MGHILLLLMIGDDTVPGLREVMDTKKKAGHIETDFEEKELLREIVKLRKRLVPLIDNAKAMKLDRQTRI